MPSAAMRGAELPSGWAQADAEDGTPSSKAAPPPSNAAQGEGLPRGWSQPPPAGPASAPEPPQPRWDPTEDPIEQTVDESVAALPVSGTPASIDDESDDPLMRSVTSVVAPEDMLKKVLPFAEQAAGPEDGAGSDLPKSNPPRSQPQDEVAAAPEPPRPAEERDPLAQSITSLVMLDQGPAPLPFEAPPAPRSRPPDPPHRARSSPSPPSDRRMESRPPPASERSTADEAAAHPALAHYAALCASCREHPERKAEVNAQYGLYDAAARRELDNHWRVHFASRPDEYDLFKRLVARYQDWLKHQAR